MKSGLQAGTQTNEMSCRSFSLSLSKPEIERHDMQDVLSPSGTLASPGPLPLGVSVVDQAIKLFGYIFPRVAQKHRLQMLNHFAEHIRQAQTSKSKSATGEAVQVRA